MSNSLTITIKGLNVDAIRCIEATLAATPHQRFTYETDLINDNYEATFEGVVSAEAVEFIAGLARTALALKPMTINNEQGHAATAADVAGWSRQRCFAWLRWNDRNGDYEPDYVWSDYNDEQVRDFVANAIKGGA